MMEIIVGGFVVVVAGVVNAVRIDNLKRKHANEVKQLKQQSKQLKQQIEQLNQDKFELRSDVIKANLETITKGNRVIELLQERPAKVNGDK
jgi:cell division protein FtsB